MSIQPSTSWVLQATTTRLLADSRPIPLFNKGPPQLAASFMLSDHAGKIPELLLGTGPFRPLVAGFENGSALLWFLEPEQCTLPNMTQDKLRSEGWRVGQRVCREDSQELGTIIEADHQIKVRWDNGQTSYFERDQTSNVKLKEHKP